MSTVRMHFSCAVTIFTVLVPKYRMLVHAISGRFHAVHEVASPVKSFFRILLVWGVQQ